MAVPEEAVEMDAVRYKIKRSKRARAMRLRVEPGGVVTLSVPYFVSIGVIERFVRKHTEWISRAIKRTSHLKTLPVSGRRDYEKYREEARAFARARLNYWSKVVEVSYGRVSIKNTKSLWGSCSHKGNLNFSYAIIFLPKELADYVIVHELCHLKENNHSKKFWNHVKQIFPNFQTLRKELKTYVLR